MSETPDSRWFGPKRFGWGWSPTSPQGWITMAAFLAAIWLSYRVLGRGWLGKLVRIKLGVLLFLVILATGSKPGSRFWQGVSAAHDDARS